MRSTLKLTLAAVAVSLALTGCKSTEGSHVVQTKKELTPSTQTSKSEDNLEKNKPSTSSETSSKKALSEEVGKDKPTKPEENGAEKVKPSTPKEETPKPAQPKPDTRVEATKPVNTDNAGKYWRVIPLANGGNLSDAGDARRESREHFVLQEDEAENSPFKADEFGKPHNYYLVLDLGKNDNLESNVKSLQSGESYLGKHNGQFTDPKLEGGNSKTVHYLFVNQPYSSYGAFYTDANDSNLFHLHLSTGRDGKKQLEEGSGSNYSEYGVWDFVNGKAKWNDGLVGDATYKGEVIARVVENKDGEAVASAPKFDGDVAIKLNLNNDWEKNKLSGTINSQTLGTITLNESKLPEARYLQDFVSFNGETKVENKSELSGYYYTQFAGEKLNDVVGKIEIENDEQPENGLLKYDAVFGATKQ
ncbi:hypothetical protein A6B39_04450 [Mannheimia granulomatis]|uniref:hypothetical protein n=1 Tax=Mannheimia granulomatis TaxID=85402 RepID=UPI00159E7DB0|nr:hypothetical protein [Mannheimia granulomatis]QLB14756.1 hypothetical protein A6B39_04450 [Mannheimia granulomatis]